MRYAILPRNFNTEKSGSCMLAAAILAKKLSTDSLNTVHVIEGWIQFCDADGIIDKDFKLSHTWVVCNNQLIDPTFGQFKEFLSRYSGVHRTLKKTYAGVFYAATFPDSVDDVRQYFTDGKVPRSVLKLIQQSVPEDTFKNNAEKHRKTRLKC